jgi:hypothetical protein
MERIEGQGKMEIYFSIGQSPQRAVSPTEEVFRWFILYYHHIVIYMIFTPSLQQYNDMPTAGSTEAQVGPADDPLLLLFPLIASCLYYKIFS